MRGPWAAVVMVLAAWACDSRPQPRETSPLAAAGHPGLYRSSTGTLAGYDPSSRVLTLRVAGGEGRFQVADDARAWIGSRGLPTSQLTAHLGAEVTLAYGEAEDGVRTTHTIRLREGHKR
jgi:hypothetical protein